AKSGRMGVLELLLINHPLDCPICDQAGECELQDFTFQEGRPATRYSPDYAKRFNPVEDFGPDVLYVPNRCILCTRCVRFMEDVAQEPVLNVSERGDRAYIGIHSEARLDHPWAGNVVDLCPVGSLLSKDFLHKARAWELRGAGGRAVVLASPKMSTEAVFLTRELCAGLDWTGAVQIVMGEAAPLAGVPNLALRPERAPNGTAAELLGYGRDYAAALK